MLLTIEGTLDAGPYEVFRFDAANPQPVLFGDGSAPEVRPEWFGAQPGNIWGPDQNGVVDLNPESILDSTTAFRLAVASLPRTGGTVRLGAGQYKITDEIVIDKNSVVFRGVGRQGLLSPDETYQFGSMLFFGVDWALNDPTATKSLLRFMQVFDPETGDTTNGWGCGVHELSVGQYPRRVVACAAAIHVESAIAFTMENCTFDWIAGSALKVSSCSLSQFSNVKVKRCGGANPAGDHPPAVWLEDAVGQGPVQGTVFTGFKVESCYDASYFYLGSGNHANKVDDLGFESDPATPDTSQIFLRVRGDRNHFGKLHFNRHSHFSTHVKLEVEASQCVFGQLTFAGRAGSEGQFLVSSSAADNQFSSVNIESFIPRKWKEVDQNKVLQAIAIGLSSMSLVNIGGERNQFGKIVCTPYKDRGRSGFIVVGGARNQIGELIDTGSRGILVGGFENHLGAIISKDCPLTALVLNGHRTDITQALIEDCSVEDEPVVKIEAPFADELDRGWSSETRASIRVVGAEDASEGILVLSGDVELLPGTQVRDVRLGHGIRWCGPRGGWNGVRVVDVGQDGFFVDGGSPVSMVDWVARQCNTRSGGHGGFRATAPVDAPERASCVGFLVREDGSSHAYSVKVESSGTSGGAQTGWKFQGNIADGGPVSLPTTIKHGVDLDSQGLGDEITVESATVALSDSANVFKMGPDSPPVQLSTITASWPGRKVTLIFTGIQTLNDNTGNLKLQGGTGSFVSKADDTMTLVCDGTDWFEVCRSVN